MSTYSSANFHAKLIQYHPRSIPSNFTKYISMSVHFSLLNKIFRCYLVCYSKISIWFKRLPISQTV